MKIENMRNTYEHQRQITVVILRRGPCQASRMLQMVPRQGRLAWSRTRPLAPSFISLHPALYSVLHPAFNPALHTALHPAATSAALFHTNRLKISETIVKPILE